MTAPQTSVADRSAGRPGQLVGSNHRIEQCTNEEASAGLAFGNAVKIGTAARLAKVPTDPLAEVDSLIGIVALNQAYERVSEIDSDGIQPDATFGLLRRGALYVSSEDAVTPASQVHVRMIANGTDLAGQFRGTIAGNPLVVPDFTFTAEADDDTLTKVAHTLKTGDGPVRVSNGGGALPAGLVAATDYWVIRVDADNFMLATSLANAIAGTQIDITTDGTGTQTLSDTASTETVATVDVSAFCSWRDSASADETAILDVDFTKAALASFG